MSTPVTMPQLGESVTEGTVTRWLKQIGETVDMDEPLLEVSTDKVDTEIPSPVAGILHSIEAPDDAIVEVGGVLGTIGTEPAEPVPTTPAAPAAPEPPRPAPPTMAPPAAPAETVAPSTTESVPASAPTGTGTEVTLPELGESVTEGTVTRWLKQVGETVDMDEPLLEISTDKVDTEIPAPVGGTLLSIAAGEDDVVEIGAVLAVIGAETATSGSPASAPAAPEPQIATPPAASPTPEQQPPAASAPPPTTPQPPVSQGTPPAASAAPTASSTEADQNQIAAAASYVTPLVRKMAAQANVDLATVSGTGVGGRIRRQDVERVIAESHTAASAPVAQPGPVATSPGGKTPAQASESASTLRGTRAPMTRLRRVIADRMVESLQTSAQLTTVVEVDVTAIARLRDRVKEQFQQRENVKLSFLPFFALAVIEALKIHPNLNASIDPDNNEITYHGNEDLGVAVDTERGLLVPVIRDAGELNLAGLARRIADLAERTRTNRVTPDELSGGTFTLTNTGSRGALFDTPIINQPQVAILGTGTVNKRPVVIPGSDGSDVIAVHSMMYLSLTYDHRLVDGADAARFLVTVKNRLEEGTFDDEVGL